MSLPFRPQPKSKATKSTRVKPTQKQMGDISPCVEVELKERSSGICEMCGKAWATERAHLTGRKQLAWKTKVADSLHLCTECHRLLDGTPEGIRCRRLMARAIHSVLGGSKRV